MNSFDKKQLSASISATKESSFIKTQDINIAMIDINVYCTTYCLKQTQVFIISIKNI